LIAKTAANLAALSSFLARNEYFSRWIQIARPWDKAKGRKPLLLAFPDLNKGYKLYTDASTTYKFPLMDSGEGINEMNKRRTIAHRNLFLLFPKMAHAPRPSPGCTIPSSAASTTQRG